MDVSHEYRMAQKRLLVLHRSISWSQMAAESGVCAATIKSFANNTTLRPQYRTVSLLADYAGFRMEIRKITNLPNEVIRLERVK